MLGCLPLFLVLLLLAPLFLLLTYFNAITLLFSAFLLPGAPLVPTLLTGAIVAAVCKAIARPVPNVGIAMPAFVPPLVAVAAALAFAPGQAAPVAYIGGTLGTLLGADLLNLPAIRRMPALML